MKTAKNILIAILIGIPFLCLVIISIPFLIIVAPFNLIRERKFKKDYQTYLETINGSNFFCYNNRKKGREFIETTIIPNLPEEVEVVFLNGRKIESEKFESRYLSRAFYEFKNYTRFPQLMKIRNGKVFDCSINKEMFKCLNENLPNKSIYDKMSNFFELKNE